MTFDFMWDLMVELGVATNKEIRLVCCINGRKKETLIDILYARTGYHDLIQYMIDEVGGED